MINDLTLFSFMLSTRFRNYFIIINLNVNKKKDISPSLHILVPAAGLEPARIIHPPDFESGTSTNFITRGDCYQRDHDSKIMITCFILICNTQYQNDYISLSA